MIDYLRCFSSPDAKAWLGREMPGNFLKNLSVVFNVHLYFTHAGSGLKKISVIAKNVKISTSVIFS